MKNKNVFYFVVLLLFIFGAVWYSVNLNKTSPQAVGQTPSQNTTPPTTPMPKFITGTVSKTEGQNVFIKVGTEEKTINIDSTTSVISQVKEGTGWKNIPATLGDVKAPLKIVVYYNQNTGSQYKADKIQILNF